jgi:hypothetical protein
MAAGEGTGMADRPPLIGNIVPLIGARRRRSGDGPKGGCARRPVGIPSPPREGAGNPVAVPCLARYGAKRADISIRRINMCRESHVHRAFKKPFLCNTGNKISRSARPICFFAVSFY